MSLKKALLSQCFFLERVKGIEPSYSAWEADVLPLNYTRMFPYFVIILPAKRKSKPFLSRMHKLSGSGKNIHTERMWI